MSSSLTTELLVQSAMATANQQMVSMVLIRRGDAKNGAVLVRLDLKDGGPHGRVIIESRSLDFDGQYSWSVLAGSALASDPPLTTEEADARLAREIGFDPDCWIVAVDSDTGHNPLRDL